MENNRKTRLFNKNFAMVVLGQFVSIFGNSVLRFALPLYILDQTGSTTIFGTVLAVSTIPVILFSPIGGILADRVKKRNMMVILDMITAIIIGVFSLLLSYSGVAMIIAVMMVLFSIIQSLYQPVVQACIPMIVNKDNLEKANGMVSMVNAVSSLLAPVAAGFLYGSFGITPIMFTGMVCFFLAAVMEVFIKIKAAPQKRYDSIVSLVRSDFKESIHYIVKENPVLLKAMIVVSCINLFLTSMILVGLPAMIKIKLALSSQLYGTSQGMIAAGMITGGVLISILGKHFKTSQVYVLLLLASMMLIPIGIAFIFPLGTMIVYWIISVCCFVMMVITTMFSITMMSFVQRETPNHLIGKVISYILMLTQCTLPIGQAIYGYFFEVGMGSISLIVLATAACSMGVALYSKAVFGVMRERSEACVAQNLL